MKVVPRSLLVSATASAAELWSAASSSKEKIKPRLGIACSITDLHGVSDVCTFRIRKAWFAAHHEAIYGIIPGVH